MDISNNLQNTLLVTAVTYCNSSDNEIVISKIFTFFLLMSLTYNAIPKFETIISKFLIPSSRSGRLDEEVVLVSLTSK